jgi:hypothetical protein
MSKVLGNASRFVNEDVGSISRTHTLAMVPDLKFMWDAGRHWITRTNMIFTFTTVTYERPEEEQDV